MAIPHLLSSCKDGVVFLTSVRMDPVTKKIARKLQHRGVPIEYTRKSVIDPTVFSDGELCPEIRHNVREKVVFLFWDFMPDNFTGHLNVRIKELELVLDALKRYGAKHVNLIVPYLPYSRQDRRMKKRQPGSAKKLAKSLERFGIIRYLVTFDLHAPQITEFYDNIIVENIPAHVIFARHFRKMFAEEIKKEELRINSTDVGGSKRARDFAEEIHPGLDIAIVDKRRDESGSKAIKIIGDVSRVMISYDDIGGTMGSMLDSCAMVMEAGSKKTFGAFTHNVCSPKEVAGDKKGKLTSAEAKIANAKIPMFTLDTLPRGKQYYKDNPLITRIPYHGFMAQAVLQLMSVNGSVSRLVDTWSTLEK